MPENEPTASEILDALGIAVFRRDETDRIRLAGTPPPWLRALWPAVCRGELPLADASPFLENFLIDARQCWEAGSGARSGPWVERDATGAEMQLEATALMAEGGGVLLIERLGESFAGKSAVLQKARETVIALERLETEKRKKEILMHCLAEDLSAALGNVVTSLRLIEMEPHSQRVTQLLSLAMRGADEQRVLIQKVLALFADELAAIYGASDTAHTAELQAAVDSAVRRAQPLFTEKGVRIARLEPAADRLLVAAEAGAIERIVAGLLDIALANAPGGGEVRIHVATEPEAARLRVEDSGEPLACDETLFAQLDRSSAIAAEQRLRLRFCCDAVRSCRGEIGYQPGAEGGNSFWVRLPISRGES